MGISAPRACVRPTASTGLADHARVAVHCTTRMGLNGATLLQVRIPVLGIMMEARSGVPLWEQRIVQPMALQDLAPHVSLPQMGSGLTATTTMGVVSWPATQVSTSLAVTHPRLAQHVQVCLLYHSLPNRPRSQSCLLDLLPPRIPTACDVTCVDCAANGLHGPCTTCVSTPDGNWEPSTNDNGICVLSCDSGFYRSQGMIKPF